MTIEQATIGHNKPPSDLDILKQRMDEEYANEVFEWDNFEEREIPKILNNEEESGKVTEYVNAMRAFKAKIEGIHVKEKKPFLDAGNFVDKWKRDYFAKIDAQISKAAAPIKDFLDRKAEAERKRQQEIAEKARADALRLQQEAALHQEAGIEDTANELSQAATERTELADRIDDGAYIAPTKVRTHSGGSAGQKKTWVGKIETIELIDLEKLRPFFKEKDIEEAIKRAVKSGIRSITGVKIFEETDVSFR